MKKVVLWFLLFIFLTSVCYSQSDESVNYETESYIEEVYGSEDELTQAFAKLAVSYARLCSLSLELFTVIYKDNKLITNIANLQIAYDEIMGNILEYWNISITNKYMDMSTTMAILIAELGRMDIFEDVSSSMALIRTDIRKLNKNDYQYTLEIYSILSQYQELITSLSCSFQSFWQYKVVVSDISSEIFPTTLFIPTFRRYVL